MKNAKSKLKPQQWLKQIFFVMVGALLTGFLTVFFAKFLGHFITPKISVPVSVGAAVALTLWFSQLIKQPPFVISGTSPFIAGFCAALGVYVSRVWLS